MRIASYILSTKQIVTHYDGTMPFAIWIKDYFRIHKKFGSRDRKIVTQLCYGFYRLGHAFSALSVEEKIAIGFFLTNKQANPFLSDINQDWAEKSTLTFEEKIKYLGAESEVEHVFPLDENISSDIEKETFIHAHFIQPNLFVRVRPGYEESLVQKCIAAGLAFTHIGMHTLAFENGTRLDEVIELDKEAVVQDLSSQQVLHGAENILTSGKNISVWDCCAASGGKSILAYDMNPNIELTVSDIRTSILSNLHKRFAKAGITKYQSFVADIAAPQFTPARQYDLVICDAPCSGSGTWSRTPEQLRFFTAEKLAYYSHLQQWIGLNAAKAIKAGGSLLYITCSVYADENEKVVEHMVQNTPLKKVAAQYYTGYNKRADTLFAALFTL